MSHFTYENIEALAAKLATMKPEIIRTHKSPTSRTFSNATSKLTLSIIDIGILIDNGFDELGTIRSGDTAHYNKFKNLINNGVNAGDFDDALNASTTLIPKISFKLRFTVVEWVSMEILAEGTPATEEVGTSGDPDYAAAVAAVSPDRIAKYWMDMYAEPSLVNVDLADIGTISIIGYLQSKNLLSAERGAEILAVEA